MTGTSLDGKVAVVTGAGRGLGRSMAIALARQGAAVVLSGRTTSALEDVAGEITAEGGRAEAIRCDVTDEASVDALAAGAITAFGSVDILVNNSGVVDTSTLLDQEPKAWDGVLDTNLRGVYLTTRSLGRHLVAQKSGKVINIASNFALMGMSHHAAYSASKAAVIAFTRSMAVEWARYNIQVNAIAPGYFATDINAEMREDEETLRLVKQRIPARRIGRPDELDPWLVLLAGPASDFMTGSTIVIDGGQSVQ